MHCTSGKLDESSVVGPCLGDVGKGRRQESTASQDGLSHWVLPRLCHFPLRNFTSPRLMSPTIQWVMREWVMIVLTVQYGLRAKSILASKGISSSLGVAR